MARKANETNFKIIRNIQNKRKLSSSRKANGHIKTTFTNANTLKRLSKLFYIVTGIGKHLAFFSL